MTKLPLAHSGTCFTGRFALYREVGRAVEKHRRRTLSDAEVTWYDKWQPEYTSVLHHIKSITSTGRLSQADGEILGQIALILSGVAAQAVADGCDDLLALEHPDVDYCLELACAICDTTQDARAVLDEMSQQSLRWTHAKWDLIRNRTLLPPLPSMPP